ncbi:MAG: UDP-N-acetylmuramoyl-tripeptide--D-alanyl-D-alanine ligase [Candidatus Omnitrophica bacterium]|nr:UDP-N-acetylmuramoyl-tripeptide--D-alanyl-D-alanine ligase [Candidatus Omnitrophota bacterium]
MFTVQELVSATQGRLTNGSPKSVVKGISIDSRTIKAGQVFVAIKGSTFEGHLFIPAALQKGASCIITQAPILPKEIVAAACIVVKDTTKALGDIARFHRKRFSIPVIAVTGSNGKTTTKEMLSWVLSKKWKVLRSEGTRNNHIGVPMALLGLNRTQELVIVELGSNHFGEIGYLAGIAQPTLGIITGIGSSHLEFLGDLTGVSREKLSLIEKLISPSVAVLNADDPLLRKAMVKKRGANISVSFGITHPADFSAGDIRFVNGAWRFKVNKRHYCRLDTLGQFNIFNALATIAVARILGMGYKEISARLAKFSFPARRLKMVRMHKVRFIDDTYNSNPSSVHHALEALARTRVKGRRIFVMGDMLELGAQTNALHRQMGDRIARICDEVITVGEFSRLSVEGILPSDSPLKNVFCCANSAEAKDILFTKIIPKEDDLVLVKGSRGMRMEEIFSI